MSWGNHQTAMYSKPDPEEKKVWWTCPKLPCSLRNDCQKVGESLAIVRPQRSPSTQHLACLHIAAALSHELGTASRKYDLNTNLVMASRVSQLGSLESYIPCSWGLWGTFYVHQTSQTFFSLWIVKRKHWCSDAYMRLWRWIAGAGEIWHKLLQAWKPATGTFLRRGVPV